MRTALKAGLREQNASICAEIDDNLPQREDMIFRYLRFPAFAFDDPRQLETCVFCLNQNVDVTGRSDAGDMRIRFRDKTDLTKKLGGFFLILLPRCDQLAPLCPSILDRISRLNFDLRKEFSQSGARL
jgi:hypothetical protein